MNLPNKITLSRILLIPVFIVLFCCGCYYSNRWCFLFAAIVFVVAACTDFLDGYIARSRGLVTNLGKFLDPIADKVLVSTALILLLVSGAFYLPFAEVLDGLSYLDFTRVMQIVAAVCVSVIMARELIVSGFRMVAAERDLVIAADKLGKVKTTCQDVSIALILLSLCFGDGTFRFVIGLIGVILFVAATVLTVLSGINYIMKNSAVLKEPAKENTNEEQGNGENG